MIRRENVNSTFARTAFLCSRRASSTFAKLLFGYFFEQNHGVIILGLNDFEHEIKFANMLIMYKVKFHPKCGVCCVLTVRESSECIITGH